MKNTLSFVKLFIASILKYLFNPLTITSQIVPKAAYIKYLVKLNFLFSYS